MSEKERGIISDQDWNIVGDEAVMDDPLTDCLLQLARIHNLDVSRRVLRAGLPLVDNRLTVELFGRAAERIGLASRVVRRPLADMTELELPAVLLLHDKQACLLIAVDQQEKSATMLMPETGMGERSVSLDTLAGFYSGYAIFARPRFNPGKGDNESVFRRKSWFWGAIFSSWRIYRDVFVASFLINLFGLTGPFFTLNVYDRVIPNLAFETLWVLATGIGVVYIFNLLMKALRGYFVDEAGKKANLEISAALFAKVLGLRMEVRPKSVGAFSKNLQQFETIRDFITSFSITSLIDLPFMILVLIAVWYIGGPVVLVHLCAIVLLVGYAMIVQLPLKKAIEKNFEASAQKNAILVEGLNGLETIKMLGAESQIQRAWEEAVSYIATWSARARLYSSSVGHFSDFVMNITTVAVVVFGVYRIAAGEMTQGGIIALAILTRQAIAPMSQVIGLMTRYHRAKAALGALDKIMALPEERPEGKVFLHRTECRGEIDLKNLNFSYPGQNTETLKNINLNIRAGEKIALIGPIGSGKTTLGKLLLGLYEPTGGMVRLDATDIRQIEPFELRRFVGYVPQDILLFRGTIKENIILGSPGIDDASVLRAAELSGASRFIGKHPKGFDMEVGEQGQGLSGGQRQSVALARALLDEPSSSMDNRTESLLKKNLEGFIGGKTFILITHRASLLDLIDRIVVIDDGGIVADGPRDQVLSAIKSGHIKF